MIEDFEIEKLEKRYLDYIVTSLRQDLKGLILGLNSRIKILNDWKSEFLKTARSGKVQLGRNQISYEIAKFKPNLPNSSFCSELQIYSKRYTQL